jgi:PAS domain S-box-containing protein
MSQKVQQQLNNQVYDKQFKALIENAHEGIVLYDMEGRIKYASKSVTKMCGYTRAELLSKSGLQFIHADDIEEARKFFRKLLGKPGENLTLFQRLRHKKGNYLWVETRLSNFLHIPEINGIVSNFRDITGEKIAEEKSSEAQTLFEIISENISEGIFMGVLEKEFLYVNKSFLRLLGYKSIQDVRGIKPAKIFADQEVRNAIVKELRKNQKFKGREIRYLRKDGSVAWGWMNVTLLKQEGKSNYFVGTLRDVTREKEAETQVQESNQFLNNIINTVAAPIFVKDEKHRWVLLNDEFCELLGYKKQVLIGKTDKDFLTPSEWKMFWKIDTEVLDTGRTIVNQELITGRKGMSHDILTIKSRYINEKGEKFIIGFITDITHLKKAEKEIRQLHSNLKGIMESSSESIFAVDHDLCYTAFNSQHKRIMKRLYGVDIETGRDKIKYLGKAKDAKWVKEELLRALKGNHFVSEHYQDFPSYKGYIQTSYNPIRDDANKVKGVAVFVQDITERKRFEQIVKSINANLRAVMESTSDGILAIDKNYRYITFNKAHAQSIELLSGKKIRAGDNFLSVITPELAKVVKRVNKKAFEGKQFSIETELSNHAIVETSFNPIFNDQNEVTGAALFIKDITKRKRLEAKLRSLNRELVQQNTQLAAQEEELKATLEELSERNFELDQLMYKTSHDLRSPLSSIMGLLNLAHLDQDPNNYQQYLSKIEGRINKLDEFIRSMLDYARVNRVEIEPEVIDLKSIAENCIKELEYLDNFHKVKTEIKVKARAAALRGDMLRMKVIFSNIISNAYKYYNPEVKSFLKIELQTNPREALISFEDNGIGIRAQHMDKIFNMFYRATDRSQGSGLGMYIVKQAIEKLNGSIQIESQYGHGTRIEIRIPNINK